METQILKLNEPYEYIYCNGSLGMHIATLIVYETNVNEDGDYELETHSHPVVKYRNRPGGTVWNRAELTDCTVLCRADNKQISMDQFYQFVSEMGNMRTEDDGEELNMRTLNVPLWKLMLDSNGITIGWPMIYKENGQQQQQHVFNVGLDIRRNPEGSKFAYTCRDMGPSDDDLYYGGSSLYFFFEFNTKDDLKSSLINMIESYYRMFEDHMFKISLAWEEGSEFADVIDEINQNEPEIREELDDVDV